jgi:hypothetical protein
MKTKLMVIGILSMFLLTGIASLTSMGMKESLLEQLLYNKTNTCDEYDGDLWCLEPVIRKIDDGLYNCKVRFWNTHSEYTVAGGWKAKIMWCDPKQEIANGTYMNDVPPETFKMDFDIEFKPKDGGWRKILVFLDCEDIRHETNETNNWHYAWHWYTIKNRGYSYSFIKLLESYPLLQTLFQR